MRMCRLPYRLPLDLLTQALVAQRAVRQLRSLLVLALQRQYLHAPRT
jgi:hypothetical protein